MSASVTWTGIGGITGRMARARVAMQAGTVAVAASQSARGERAMKAGAPWTDRTGHARQSLYGESEATPTGARITLGGSAEYIPMLELGTVNMSPRSIITPTAQVTAREAADDLLELARRFGA